MENVLEWAKVGIAAAGGVLAFIFGPWDTLIIVLIAFVTIDYLTGITKAAVNHVLSSAIGFKGLLKKVFIFVLVAVATLIDKVIPATNEAIRAAVMLFYIANEGLSILENAGEMGLPLPGALK